MATYAFPYVGEFADILDRQCDASISKATCSEQINDAESHLRRSQKALLAWADRTARLGDEETEEPPY